MSEKQRWALSESEEAFIRRRLFMLRAWIELRAIGKRGDIERLQQLSQELDVLPEDEEAIWEIIPLSFAYWLALPHPRASTLLITRLRQATQRMMEGRDYQMAIRLKSMLAVLLVLHARLHQAQQQCLEGVTLLQRIEGHAPWEGHLYYSLFSVSYACNRLEEASNWLLRMLQAAQDWQQVELLVRGQIYSVRLALAKGDLPQARQARQKLETLIEQDGFALHTPWISAVRVQVWLAEGNLMEASAWATRTTFSEGTWNLLRRCELLMLARVLLVQQQNFLAAQTLERFRPYFERPAALQTEVEWTALAVLALHRCGKHEQALQEATRLLTITEPEGYVRLDLDTGEPLMKEVLTIWLEAHPKAVSQSSTVVLSRSSVLRMLTILERDTTPAQESESLSKFSQNAIQNISLEPLSRQERQVLRLLATGQTYAEMAQTLVVSINTIKTQVSNIYRKLGVSRRADAIAVAARMHLV
ncbi:LuxR C-terminal-related transcriptional regulator [Reticulibacter mediterranei]|uniref:LuxR C-terminal-related transcriptional regulator n=1 Tax=Reticulibacter mediterranei TaxID=2778369 RepID=UPI001F299DEC|nr:LuxR C-terminal-related transcriptional regulator [Reticulibacter mediterranei]